MVAISFPSRECGKNSTDGTSDVSAASCKAPDPTDNAPVVTGYGAELVCTANDPPCTGNDTTAHAAGIVMQPAGAAAHAEDPSRQRPDGTSDAADVAARRPDWADHAGAPACNAMDVAAHATVPTLHETVSTFHDPRAAARDPTASTCMTGEIVFAGNR